jgi:ankyrin repeat protein
MHCAAAGGILRRLPVAQQQQQLVLMPAAQLAQRPRSSSSSSSGGGDQQGPLPYICTADTISTLSRRTAAAAAADALGWRPLHWAVARGSTLAVVRLLAGDTTAAAVDSGGVDVNAVTQEEGWSALHLAFMKRDKKMVQLLLSLSACVVSVFGHLWEGGGAAQTHHNPSHMFIRWTCRIQTA